MIGIGRKDGNVEKIKTPFYYDADIGWFYYEYDLNEKQEALGGHPTKLRLWSISGYKEIQPKQPSDANKGKSP